MVMIAGRNLAGMTGTEAAELVQKVTEQLEGISHDLVAKVEVSWASKKLDFIRLYISF